MATTTFKKDPAPGATPGDGSIIKTDQHNLMVDILNGEHASDFVNPVFPIATKTGSYTMTLNDFMILANAVGGAFTVTLPAAAGTGIKRKILVIKKIDATLNKVTVDGNASETIDGLTTIALEQPNETLIIESDETNWRILAHYTQNLKRDTVLTSTPSDPTSGFAKLYAKQIDANNDAYFSKQKIGGAFVEVQIT